jgi:hypothetical protein
MLPKKHLLSTEKRKEKQEEQSIVIFYELYIYRKVIFIIRTIYNNFDIKIS